jgi:membrane-bound acyltransferase YfiQ involved in biofilm formation
MVVVWNIFIHGDYYLCYLLQYLFMLSVPIEEWLFASCLGVGCTYTYEAVFNIN